MGKKYLKIHLLDLTFFLLMISLFLDKPTLVKLPQSKFVLSSMPSGPTKKSISKSLPSSAKTQYPRQIYYINSTILSCHSNNNVIFKIII